MSLRDTFLAAGRKKKQIVVVPTPELAPECPEVYVRVLSGRELDAYHVSCVDISDEDDPKVRRDNTTARLCVFSMCDADGNRLYTLEDLDDVAQGDGPVLKRIYNAAAKLNAVRLVDREEIKNGCSPQESSGSCGTESPPITDCSSGSSSTAATPPSSPSSK
jgi:hypothetical protein